MSLEASAPLEWNLRPDSATLYLKDALGYGWSLEIHNAGLRQKLLQSNSLTRVFLAQILREDAETLFGFESLAERDLFSALRDMDSIGPKIAALILAHISFDELERLATGELKSVPRKIPGLGPKMQEKLMLGLRQKRDLFLELLHGLNGSMSGPRSHSPSTSRSKLSVPASLVQSMESLGLRSSDTEQLWQTLSLDDPHFGSQSNAEIVRRLLQEWGRMKTRTKASSLGDST